MNRLVWVAVTAIAGYYLKKRNKEIKQTALSQSSYRAAESIWYDGFTFMESEGYVIEEERTGVSYRLLCKRPALAENPELNFLFLLRHPNQPEGYVFIQEELVSLHTFEPLFEKTLNNSKDPLRDYANLFEAHHKLIVSAILDTSE